MTFVFEDMRSKHSSFISKDAQFNTFARHRVSAILVTAEVDRIVLTVAEEYYMPCLLHDRSFG